MRLVDGEDGLHGQLELLELHLEDGRGLSRPLALDGLGLSLGLGLGCIGLGCVGPHKEQGKW